MRNPERLDSLYLQMAKIHKKYAPDIRFGQMMCNFERYCISEGRDMFFFEDTDFLAKFREYIKEYFVMEDGEES